MFSLKYDNTNSEKKNSEKLRNLVILKGIFKHFYEK